MSAPPPQTGTRSLSVGPFPSKSFLSEDRLIDRAETGPRWLGEPRIAGIVQDAIRHGETQLALFGVGAFVIMINHVHVLVRPHVPLERITRVLKGFTAWQANRILGRSGQRFWQAESFDHWVRSDEEFSRIAAYVEQNPVSAGLVQKAQDWPWSSAHK